MLKFWKNSIFQRGKKADYPILTSNQLQEIELLENGKQAESYDYDCLLELSSRLSSNQLSTIIYVLNKKGFEHMLVQDRKLSRRSLLFIRFNDPRAFLKEAEKHSFLKRMYKDKGDLGEENSLVSKLKRLFIQKGSEKLDPRIKELETSSRFTYANRKKFIENVSNLDQEETVRKPTKKTKNRAKTRLLSDTCKLDSEYSLGKNQLNIGNTVSFGELPRINSQILKEENMSILDETISTFSLVSKSPSKKDIKAPSKRKQSIFQENLERYMRIFTSSERLEVVWSIINSMGVPKDPSFFETFPIKEKENLLGVKFIEFLKKHRWLSSIKALHTGELETKVNLKDPNSIKNYFGSKIAIYFEFKYFYIKWLAIPAVCGIINQYQLFNSDLIVRFCLDIFYCIMTMIWVIFFVRFWERKTSEIRARWGVLGTKFTTMNTRAQFKGKLRINQITELPEVYISPIGKWMRYCLSGWIHLPLFLISIFAAIMYLNAKGIVNPKHYWIYIEPLASLSQNGGILTLTKYKYLLKVMRVVVKYTLKAINNQLSKLTTNLENHRTHYSYDNSLIIKRFLFGIINTFTNLIYIAFWKSSFSELKEELLIVYISAEVKKLFSGTFVPYIRRKIVERRFSLSEDSVIECKNRDQYDKNKLKAYILDKVKEANSREFDLFKDYLVLVNQINYLTLFAVAFPLSGIISLLLNIAEARSYSLKLKSLSRRPVSGIVNGIGSWLDAIRVISYLSIITNSILIANSIEFRTTMTEEFLDNTKEEEKGEKVLGIVFLVEHIMILLIFVIRRLIPKEPTWVRIYAGRNSRKGSGF